MFVDWRFIRTGSFPFFGYGHIIIRGWAFGWDLGIPFFLWRWIHLERVVIFSGRFLELFCILPYTLFLCIRVSSGQFNLFLFLLGITAPFSSSNFAACFSLSLFYGNHPLTHPQDPQRINDKYMYLE
jgi:hypothetical protein